mmetsp:Transcript_22311/g.54510  ORF Transcript_22311/g.54510 Transcript_22311/m.54510 type:complete len:220 (+) Transcript_22311:180-839(+)
MALLNDATVTPSSTRWSALHVTFMRCARRTSPRSSKRGSTRILASAAMATSGSSSTGVALVPPTVPMLDSEMVPPRRSAGGSLPAAPSACRRVSSCATSNTLRRSTFLMLGTSRPCGVSMATPTLCAALSCTPSAAAPAVPESSAPSASAPSAPTVTPEPNSAAALSMRKYRCWRLLAAARCSAESSGQGDGPSETLASGHEERNPTRMVGRSAVLCFL